MTIFTPQERRVVLFLTLSLLVGSGVKLYRSRRASRLFPATAGIVFTSDEDSGDTRVLDTLIAEVERMVGGEGIVEKDVVDINTATEMEFRMLPGIGPKLAARIVSHRETHGKFKLVRDLVRVPGIGEKKLAAIEEIVFVGSEDARSEKSEDGRERGANRP